MGDFSDRGYEDPGEAFWHPKKQDKEFVSHGAISILNERERQVMGEEYDSEHDDYHEFGELAKAAACYAIPPECRQLTGKLHVPTLWPWEDENWKPDTKNRIRELIKAGALIAAEIDRLLRKEKKERKKKG